MGRNNKPFGKEEMLITLTNDMTLNTGSIKDKTVKEYLKPILFGRGKLNRKFYWFLLDILSISRLPLPGHKMLEYLLDLHEEMNDNP